MNERRALDPRNAISFRTAVRGVEGSDKRVRVAVLLRLTSPDGQDWKVEGAQLATQGGVRPNVTVWQSSPVKSGTWDVMVEAEVPEEEARGRFTLKLWDASGSRTFSASGVTFP